MIERPRVDLPEPLSPTTPRTWPRWRSKLTCLTAWTVVVAVGKMVVRSRTLSSGVLSFNAAGPGKGRRRKWPRANRGSKKSAKPSAARLIASTVTRIARPGKIAIQAVTIMYWRPSARIVPQDGVGGVNPRARKLSSDSTMTKKPRLSIPISGIDCQTLGRT